LAASTLINFICRNVKIFKKYFFERTKKIEGKYRIFWTIQEFFSDMESSKLIRFSIGMC
jgi:hypothetical protein